MWDWGIRAALMCGALTGIGALALLAARARQAWRDIKDARQDIVGRLDDLAARAEATADRVAAAGDTAELRRSLGRLRVSLARLAVLRAAIDEAQDTLGNVIVVAPRK